MYVFISLIVCSIFLCAFIINFVMAANTVKCAECGMRCDYSYVKVEKTESNELYQTPLCRYHYNKLHESIIKNAS